MLGEGCSRASSELKIVMLWDSWRGCSRAFSELRIVMLWDAWRGLQQGIF
jgi:hypothetical protein